MATATPLRMPDETITRLTKEGRKLRYCLSVIQQPERARACGSGAKSSADRRPVDPPPVVELRIYHDIEEGSQEVTFAYNANFFLFATLEVARPMAHGRLQPAPQVPVLTGMPVSGMAYLDRPSEAGYFIFPDLSVRHEGRYKLSFNLYEETKDAKDADQELPKDPSSSKPPPMAGPTPESSFDWRMEVKSNAFTVFSAKKFPGLAESTPLSKTVAEQGCRVRIRRDVRMRRRDGKDNREFDEAGEDEYTRAERASTPGDHGAYRQRPLGNNDGNDVRQPYPEPAPRRGSGDFSAQAYPYTPSSASSRSSVPSNYPAYPGPTGGQYQPQTAQFVHAQAQPPPAPPTFLPAQGAYHHPGSHYRPPPPPPQANYGYAEQTPYPPSHPHSRGPREQEMNESEYRRLSIGHVPPPPPQAHRYTPMDSNYTPSASSSYNGYPPRAKSPTIDLAPIRAMGPKYDGIPSPAGPLTSVNRLVAPLRSPGHDQVSDPIGSYSPYQALPQRSNNASRNGKRRFDRAFNSSSTTQPLYNGQRPSSSHGDNLYGGDDDGEIDMNELKMQYKRADGSNYYRDLPSVE